MRIIAGLAKGMNLCAPQDGAVRPTADRVRAAIFSSLAARVAGAAVLDLFAGTGALGLEAASRGAVAVTFVEQLPAALQCLRQNITLFRARGGDACDLSILAADARVQIRHLCSHHPFTLIFADPPYGPIAQELLVDVSLPQILAPDGLFVLETARRTPLVESPIWLRLRESVYGDTRVSLLRPPTPPR